MGAIAANPILLNCQHFIDFLKIEGETEFNNAKKEAVKLKPPSKLSEFKSIEGEIKLKLSKEYDNNAENVKNYINFNDLLIKRLGTSYKNLFLEMNTVALRMREISEIYDQLKLVSEKSCDVNNLYIRI